jgi:hypothetical protein
MRKMNLVTKEPDGKYDPREVIQLGMPAVAHLVPEYVTDIEVQVALLQARMRCEDIFHEVSLFPPERLRTPAQVSIAIRQVLFHSFESALTQLTLHKIPV